MNYLPSQCSVLIVGAGPSGLMMAAQLLRFGIQPIIIDSKKEMTKQSRALAVQARSLEIFRQLGLDGIASEQGNVVKGAAVYENSVEVLKLDLSEAGSGKSAFPHILTLEQNKTEKILLDYLTSKACPVYWDTELSDLKVTDEMVDAHVKRGLTKQTVRCEWLIGADGASSKIRKALGLAFSGGTYLNRFYLADLQLADGPPPDFARVFLKDEGFGAMFPLPGGRQRFIGVLPKTLKDRKEISFDDLKPYITYTLGFPLQGGSSYWFSIYQLHHRMADRFRVQSCFLIGDAAHVHSPVGGQGMNTGLQDAYNLAWKLAGVIKKQFDGSILESYSSERMPVARELLKTTDRLFTMAVSGNWLIRKIRNWFLSKIVFRMFQERSITGNLFSRISQTGIHYRRSPLSVHHSNATKVKAGDRLPFLSLFDEKLKEYSDLHFWCSKPGFTLLVIGLLSQRDVHLLSKWIKSTYPSDLHFYYLPPSDRNQHIFDYFEIPDAGKKAIIVRPDLHIGYLNDIVDIELIDTYLKQSLGWKKNSPPNF